jgi:hypothetical protein
MLEGRALLSGLSVSLTTNQSVYAAGQPVQMTFTETNTSTLPKRVVLGPSIDGFNVTQNGVLVWRSNAGNTSQALLVKILEPGKSVTLTQTWDGEPTTEPGAGSATTSPVSGTFNVTNQLDPTGAYATFVIEPAISSSLTTNQSVYQAGQPIMMAYTETNDGLQPVTITLQPAEFIVTSNGKTVWQSPATTPSAGTSQTLQPGQSVTQTAVWNGSSGGSGRAVNLWGSFVMSNPNAPGKMASFQITNPLVPSISTDHSVYQVGQPIEFTSTLTNTSTQPITIGTAQGPGPGIDVTENGTIIWSSASTGGGSSPSTETIQPGQSITLSATWDGLATSGVVAPVPVTGAFVVSVAGNPFWPTTSFQIVNAVSYGISVDHTSYQAGQPITITFTETNTASQPVQVVVEPPSFAVTGSLGGNVVWQSAPAGSAVHGQTQTLQPGQSITQTATWNGVASRGSFASTNVWGSFTVTNNNGPQKLSAAFMIQDPITATLTTNPTSYVVGTPVHITATETNTSQYPVVVKPSGHFTVTNTQTGTIVFNQSTGGLTTVLATLQPGHSVTRMATWDPAQAGPFTIAYQDVGVVKSLAVQVASNSTTPPVPTSPVASSLSTARRGTKIMIMFTLKNVSAAAVALPPVSLSDGFSVLAGSTVIWHTPLNARSIKTRTLAPGASITIEAVWNGRPNVRGAAKATASAHTIVAKLGPYVASAKV